jgi:hypothetical protein
MWRVDAIPVHNYREVNSVFVPTNFHTKYTSYFNTQEEAFSFMEANRCISHFFRVNQILTNDNPPPKCLRVRFVYFPDLQSYSVTHLSCDHYKEPRPFEWMQFFDGFSGKPEYHVEGSVPNNNDFIQAIEAEIQRHKGLKDYLCE